VAYLRTSDGRRELRALQHALEEPIIGAGARARVIWSSALEWLLQA
jgi:hypothetical protein